MDKISFTFWVTEKCNLRCRYCYVSKETIDMDKVTADKCLNFVDAKMKEHDGKERMQISFHGGEPLLNFDIIRYMVEKMIPIYGDRLFFEMTTNGTTYEEVIYDFLMKHKFILSISLDGTKECNDLNRLTCKGESTYSDVIHSLNYFKRCQYSVRVRMTVNTSNVKLFADSFINLFEKKYGVVAFALDTSDEKCDKEFYAVYKKELEKILKFLKEYDTTYYNYYLTALKQAHLSEKINCTGGTQSFHISGKGNIYPCMLSVQKEEFNIGNVESGIDELKLECIQQINRRRNPGCKECGAKRICEGETCKIINKIHTDDFLQPCKYNCSLKRLYNDLLSESR